MIKKRIIRVDHSDDLPADFGHDGAPDLFVDTTDANADLIIAQQHNAGPIATGDDGELQPPADVIAPGGRRWTDGGTSSGGTTTSLPGSGGVVAWSLAGVGLTNQSGQSFFTGSTVDMGTFLPFDFASELRRAFDAWAAVGNIEFIQVADGGGNIGNGNAPSIRVVGGFIDGDPGGGSTLARAFFPFSGAGGDIVFDSGDGDFFSNPQNFFLTALHEIGHALGLDHEEGVLAIMNGTINTSLTGLQTDDINSIRELYGNQDFGANTFFMPVGQTALTLIDGAPSLTIRGNASGNTITGAGSDDRIQGAGGNDTINGGGGTDFAVFSGNRSGYTLTDLGGGSVQVSGADGVDTLNSVERLVFDDQTITWPPPPETIFQSPFLAFSGFAKNSGGWITNDLYPRTLADVNADGRADIIGFGAAGVYISLANADGTFQATAFKLDSFGASLAGGGWASNNQYPRAAADVNGDNRADIVGFGDTATYVSLANADGTFQPVILGINSFGFSAAGGGWNTDNQYPRTLGDVNGDGRADIVGFGDIGVYVALGNVNGTFQSPIFALNSLGFSPAGGGWSSNDKYPRTLGDVNGDGRDDLVGFGDSGVYVAFGNANGTFQNPILAINSFGFSPAGGGWSSNDRYPRRLGDVDSDGDADIVGFGDAGLYIALSNGNGTFAAATFDLAGFAPSAGGWTSNNDYPRLLADVNADGRADVVGFADGGVFVSLADIV